MLSALDLPAIPADTLPDLPPELSKRIVVGLRALSVFLFDQCRRMNKDSDATPEQRRIAKENVPWDKVPDPPAFTASFRALVLAALGEREEDQVDLNGITNKKRKAESDLPSSRPTARQATAATAAGSAAEVKPAETVVTKSSAARPMEDGSAGPLEDVEVRTTTSETKAVRIVRAVNGKIIREVRTSVALFPFGSCMLSIDLTIC